MSKTTWWNPWRSRSSWYRNGNSRFVISPFESKFLKRWDVVMITVMSFVSIVTPYEVAFVSGERSLDWFLEGADGLFWVNRLVDGVFVVDLCLQFFISYSIQNKYGVTYVKSHALIVKHYVTTWFAVDFVSIMPYDLGGILMDSEQMSRLRAIRLAKVLRLLKMARLLRGLRIVQRWELDMTTSFRSLTLWYLLVTVLLATHWMACLLGLLAAWEGDGLVCAMEREPLGCVTTWFTSEASLLLEGGYEITTWRSYLVALHIGASIMVHPHSGTPTNEAELIAFVVLIFVGGFIWTRVISRTTAVQTSLDRHTIFFKQTMDDLNDTIRELSLDPTLARRLRQFFLSTKGYSKKNTWRELVSRMSPLLKSEVAERTHRTWLLQVRYLRGVSRLFLANLAPFIEMEFLSTFEVFGKSFTMYIMHKGLATKTFDAGAFAMKILRPGCVWGEDHLLLDSWYLLESNTARTMTFVEVMTLRREDFRKIYRLHPEVEARIRKAHVRCACVRGLLFFARQELKKRKAEVLGKEQTNTSSISSFVSTSTVGGMEVQRYKQHMRMNAEDAKTLPPAFPVRKSIGVGRKSIVAAGQFIQSGLSRVRASTASGEQEEDKIIRAQLEKAKEIVLEEQDAQTLRLQELEERLVCRFDTRLDQLTGDISQLTKEVAKLQRLMLASQGHVVCTPSPGCVAGGGACGSGNIKAATAKPPGAWPDEPAADTGEVPPLPHGALAAPATQPSTKDASSNADAHAGRPLALGEVWSC